MTSLIYCTGYTYMTYIYLHTYSFTMNVEIVERVYGLFFFLILITVDLLQFSNSPSSILHRQFSKHNHFTFQSFLCLYTWHTGSRYCTHDILSMVCVVCEVHVFCFFVHRSWLYLLRLTHLVTGYSVTNLISRDQDHPSSFYVSPPDLGFLPSTF